MNVDRDALVWYVPFLHIKISVLSDDVYCDVGDSDVTVLVPHSMRHTLEHLNIHYIIYIM